MDISEISKRALEIRSKYAELEMKKFGHEWSNKEIFKGFKKDVSDLESLIADDQIRPSEFAHELSDCLWSILVMANKYEIDIEKSFLETMNDLEQKIKQELDQ